MFPSKHSVRSAVSTMQAVLQQITWQMIWHRSVTFIIHLHYNQSLKKYFIIETNIDTNLLSLTHKYLDAMTINFVHVCVCTCTSLPGTWARSVTCRRSWKRPQRRSRRSKKRYKGVFKSTTAACHGPPPPTASTLLWLLWPKKTNKTLFFCRSFLLKNGMAICI